MELARTVKTPEELKCLQLSADVCDIAIDRMRRALQPGITENLTSLRHPTAVTRTGWEPVALHDDHGGISLGQNPGHE